MPRPKGSKNKPTLTIDEQIVATGERIDRLKEELAAAEETLKTLTALRDEEQMKELKDAIAASGKSVADVIAMLKTE